MTVADEIATNNVIWGDLMKAGNAEGIAALYTSNCEVLPAGAPMINGKADFQKLLEGIITAGCTSAKLTSAEIQPDADKVQEGGTVWERGNFVFYKDDDAIMDSGKYVVIWKRVNGKLRIYKDIMNSNGN